jgi:uncharacterized membrane protein YoaK (UPF0700 family)
VSRPWPEGSYIAALLVMTTATGAIDGVSYLALDRVFTGNMTGNVLFIGFGLVGVADIPVLNNLVALVAFMLGAVIASRITRRAPTDVHLPRSSVWILVTGTLLTLALAVVWLAVGALDTGVMIAITGFLALLLGAQAAAVKSIGLRDLSTVVVTMTMVNLSSDSRVAGGTGAAWARRIGAIVCMGLGALIAAVITTHVGGAWALLAAGGLMVLGVGLLWNTRRVERDGLREGAAATPAVDERTGAAPA